MISTGSRGERATPAQVTSLVNHELSSPLATALLYLGIAEGHCAAGPGGQPAGQVRSALSVARAEIQRLKQLVDRVTELEQLGRAVLRPVMVDLGAVVADTVERAMLPGGEGESPVTIESPRGLVGWWDDVAVSQIVINLLSNALKFGHGGSVRIVVRASGDHAWISVQDNGVGVRPIDRERIFEVVLRESVAIRDRTESWRPPPAPRVPEPPAEPEPVEAGGDATGSEGAGDTPVA